jgi:hypothetical protein
MSGNDVVKTKEEILESTLEGLSLCNHAPMADIQAVSNGEPRVTEAYELLGDYAESESAAVGQLRDGRWFAAEQSEDTTGHGCQCSGVLGFYSTEEEAVRLGLSQWARDHFQADKSKRSEVGE